jgi:uncharacterized protein (DUF488 family)
MAVVLTIGHSNHLLERLIELLHQQGVSAVADVRSYPASRQNPQFDRDQLRQALRKAKIAYVFLGKELGGRPNDPSCYERGRVQYARVAKTPVFREGLRRVMRGANRHRIALLCAEREPLACHRTLLVARELEKNGVEVAHIHADGTLETHKDAMVRLLQILGLLDQHDIFRNRDELIAEACAIQEERIAYVDEEARKAASG